MSVATGIAGGAISGGLNNIMSFADSFHDWEWDNRKTGIVPYLDPGGSFLGYLNNRSEKKAAKKQREWAEWQAALQWKYQKAAALEMPTYLRQGYEDAGYNALLALGQTGGVTNAVSKVDAGEYPHQIERRNREANLLVDGAIQQQAAQIEKIKAETRRTNIGSYKDVLGTAISVLGGLYGLSKLTPKLLSASTTNAAAGTPVDRVVRTFKNGKAVNPQLGRVKDLASAAAAAKFSSRLNTLGKIGSVGALLGFTGLMNEAAEWSKAHGYPTQIPSSAYDKARKARFGETPKTPIDFRKLKNQKW